MEEEEFADQKKHLEVSCKPKCVRPLRACQMGDNAEWNEENTITVCQLFAEQVVAGNRPTTHLNNHGYAVVITKFADKTGLQYTKRQFKNKWDKLKNDYNIWRKIKIKETGLSWDHEKNTIKTTKERWKVLKKEYPGCSKFQKAGLQNEELLDKMFGDIHSIGTDYWSSAIGTLPQSPVEDIRNTDSSMVADDKECGDANDGNDFSEEEEDSPVSGKDNRPCDLMNYKRKRSKSGSLVIQEQLKRIVALNESSHASFESFVRKREEDAVCSIKDVMRLVEECGAVNGGNEHFIASEIFIKKEQREMFMTLHDNNSRFEWLKRKYESKYGK